MQKGPLDGKDEFTTEEFSILELEDRLDWNFYLAATSIVVAHTTVTACCGLLRQSCSKADK